MEIGTILMIIGFGISSDLYTVLPHRLAQVLFYLTHHTNGLTIT